jgi:hypothetical protein
VHELRMICSRADDGSISTRITHAPGQQEEASS